MCREGSNHRIVGRADLVDGLVLLVVAASKEIQTRTAQSGGALNSLFAAS